MRKHIFNAGPAVLPESTLKTTSEAVIDLDGLGVSILEISHRSKEFMAIMEETKSLLKELMVIPDGYSILFLQGGASLQFCMVPYNLLSETATAAYLETGVWAKKAIKEAKLFGNVEIVASSSDKNFSYIPSEYSVPQEASYLHITSNNTIYGTQVKNYPETEVVKIIDMSSDILSRPMNVAEFGMIYAGAQKNLGPSGITLVIIKDDIVGNIDREIPSLLNYQTHIDNNSLFNTTSVFAIYACLQTLKWIKKEGGVKQMEAINKAKAEKLYNEIDSNPVFEGTANETDRSLMNVPFVLANPGKEEEFLKLATEHDIIGIKGHRSVGGFRASMYNALPIEGVDVLVSVMQQFAKENG